MSDESDNLKRIMDDELRKAFTADELVDLTKRWPKEWKGKESAKLLGLSVDDIPRFMNTIATLSAHAATFRSMAYIPLPISLNNGPQFQITYARFLACVLRHKYGPLRIQWEDIVAMDGCDGMKVDGQEKGMELSLASAKGRGIILNGNH